MLQKIIDVKSGESFIFKEKTSQTSQVVSIKLSSREHKQVFIRDHVGNKTFLGRYEGFWCSMS